MGFRILCIAKLLNFCNTLCFDLVLIKLLTISMFPLLVLLHKGRMLKPRKSTLWAYFFSEVPRRFTILVFVGCSVSLHAVIRCFIIAETYNACFSVLQCTSMSSA